MVAADRRPAHAAPDVALSAGLKERATFICGHPKSGTSLVTTLLDSHPELIVYPEETHYFRRFLPQTAGLSAAEQLRQAEELIIGIFRWNADRPHPSQAGFPDRDYSDIDYAAVMAKLRGFAADEGETERTAPSAAYETDAERAVLPAAILAYGAVSGMLSSQAKRWVEKTPYNEHYADQIFELWPAAKCVHVVRDPRDNYASYRRKHPDWSPWTFARSWQRSCSAGLRNRQRFGADCYWILRYEELVSAPEETVGRLVEFLGIEHAPTLRRPTRAGKPWVGNSMFDEQFEGISADPLGRYREHLSSGTIRRLEWALGPQMRKLGYPLESASLPDRALGWFVRSLWNLWSRRPASRQSQAELAD